MTGVFKSSRTSFTRFECNRDLSTSWNSIESKLGKSSRAIKPATANFEAVSFPSLFGILFEVFVGDMPFVTARSLFFYRERYDFFIGQHRIAAHVVLKAGR